MSFMMAFGWASIMLCLGVFLRAKISFLRNMLVSASIIAGILGFIFVNVCYNLQINFGTETEMYTLIVDNLFTVSFISISLTSTSAAEKNSSKKIFKGVVALGLIWCLLYAVTPVIAALVIFVIGKAFNMDAVYGMLIQFAFCQGPGQAATYGRIFEQYGWKDASMAAITFAAIGFAAAFFTGSQNWHKKRNCQTLRADR